MHNLPCTNFNTQSPHYIFLKKGNKMLQGLALIKQTSTFLNIVPSCVFFFFKLKNPELSETVGQNLQLRDTLKTGCEQALLQD